MIWVLMYLIGYCVSGVMATRGLASSLYRCHAENSDHKNWTYKQYCKRWCRDGCWRDDGGHPTVGHALSASGLALLWPLFVPPYLFWVAARYERKPKGLSQGELDRLDRVLEGKEDA